MVHHASRAGHHGNRRRKDVRGIHRGAGLRCFEARRQEAIGASDVLRPEPQQARRDCLTATQWAGYDIIPFLDVNMSGRRQGKVKRAAAARPSIAFHAHLPTEFVHNTAHDGQAKPMPFSVNLIEARERFE